MPVEAVLKIERKTYLIGELVEPSLLLETLFLVVELLLEDLLGVCDSDWFGCTRFRRVVFFEMRC